MITEKGMSDVKAVCLRALPPRSGAYGQTVPGFLILLVATATGIFIDRSRRVVNVQSAERYPSCYIE